MVGWLLFHWRNGLHSLRVQAACSFALRSVAGFGVVGPLGPRVGNSSGILPGNSSGCGGAPGSRMGGGTSGRGFPGGLSIGGSVGCPGVAGGISGGSIGITSPEGFSSKERQRRDQREVPWRRADEAGQVPSRLSNGSVRYAGA